MLEHWRMGGKTEVNNFRKNFNSQAPGNKEWKKLKLAEPKGLISRAGSDFPRSEHERSQQKMVWIGATGVHNSSRRDMKETAASKWRSAPLSPLSAASPTSTAFSSWNLSQSQLTQKNVVCRVPVPASKSKNLEGWKWIWETSVQQLPHCFFPASLLRRGRL